MIEIRVLASSSRGNCYHVTDGITPVLLECGISWKEIQRDLNFKTSELTGCLVSHEHKDHCKAVKDIIKAGIDCYMSIETAEALDVYGHRIKIVRPKEQFRLGSWTILPFDTIHDAEGSLGFLLANNREEKLLYLTDSMYCRYSFNKLTHIMIETNYSSEILRENVASGKVPVEMKRRVIRSHMSLETAKDFLRANDLSQVQEIHLLHLSDNNSDAAKFKREIQELTGKPVYVAG